MSPDLRPVTERRDQALRDLAALEAQVAAGELTAEEATPLRLRYERQAADAIAALDDPEPTPADDPPVSGGPDDPAPPRSPARRAGLWAGVAAVVVVAVSAGLTVSVGDRPAGGYTTGNEAAASAPPPSQAAGRDLSKVTDAEMERVVAANPDVPGMRLALADRYVVEGRYDQAVTHYLAVLKRDPGSPEAQAGLAWVLFQTGRPEQALPIVDRALQRDPDLQRGLWAKANILLYSGGDPAGAISLLRRMARQPLAAEVRKQVTDLIAVAEARRSGG